MRVWSALLVGVVAATAFAVAVSARSAPGGAGGEAPWLGIGIDTGNAGVRVTDVIDETPAADAGLIADDEILAVDGVPVGTRPDALVATIRRYRVGDRIELLVAREGKRLRTSAVLGAQLSRHEVLYRRLVGKPAPAFDLPVVVGAASGALDDLRGQVVVVQFWATWCQPCQESHRALTALASARAADGLAVVAISDESEAALRSYVQRVPPAFTVLRDDGATTSAYHVGGLRPVVVVIDRDGVVRYAGLGGDYLEPRQPTTEEALLELEHAVFAAERALRVPPTSRPGRAPKRDRLLP
jgi:peroxiredoxin